MVAFYFGGNIDYRNKRIYKLKKLLNKIDEEVNASKNIDYNINKLNELLNQPYFSVEIKDTLSKAYVEAGRTKEGLDLLKFLYELTDKGEYLIRLVHLLMNIGDVKEADNYIKNATYSNEKIFASGVYHKRLGDYDEAINYLSKLKHTTMEEDMYVEMASVYMIAGNNEEAKKCFYKILNTSHKYQSLVRLIKMALGENDPNVISLLSKFNRDDCYHLGDLLQFKRCIQYYEYLNGTQTEQPKSYLGSQLYKYDKNNTLQHIRYKHMKSGSLYRFYEDIDLDSIYEYCASHLKYLAYKDNIAHYLVELPYDVGYLMDYKTNLVEVATIANTDKILTIFPITKVGKYNIEKIKKRSKENEK